MVDRIEEWELLRNRTLLAGALKRSPVCSVMFGIELARGVKARIEERIITRNGRGIDGSSLG